MVDMTKEEVLLQVLLGVIDGLVAVFKLYEDFEAAANAATVPERGGMEQTTDTKALAFWQYIHRFDIASTIPENLS